jgi:hypothetical protein
VIKKFNHELLLHRESIVRQKDKFCWRLSQYYLVSSTQILRQYFNSDRPDRESCQSDFLWDASCVLGSVTPTDRRGRCVRRASGNPAPDAAWHLVVGTVLTPKFGTENRIINKLWKWILVTLYSLVLVWQNYTDCLLMNRRGRVRGGGGSWPKNWSKMKSPMTLNNTKITFLVKRNSVS